MKKIKVIENKKIIVFDFNATLLKNNILFEICKELQLTDIYIDIFGINNQNLDFSKRLTTKNDALILHQIEETNCWSIKATINDIPLIIDTLTEFEIDELNVWDVYTDWNEYLKDKIRYKSTQKKDESRVYLNYNLCEGDKVELFLNPNYNAEQIRHRLEKLIN